MESIQFVVSCQGDCYDLCQRELLASQQYKIKLVKWLDLGIGVFEVWGMDSFQRLSEYFREMDLIFQRHMFPLMQTIVLDGKIEENIELSDFLAAAEKEMDKDKAFSVQVRHSEMVVSIVGDHDLTVHLVDYLTEKGYRYDAGNPVQIISCIIRENILHLGISESKDNGSSWSGGMRHYKKEEEQISRAEFKLLEAIEVFGLENYLQRGMKGLDLGAAPGGWTKVLLSYGLNVVAVDPAELAPILLENSSVEHFKGLAQDFVAQTKNQVDIVVNDMRMDVTESAKIMLDIAEVLTNDGLGIMTFKLPQKDKMKKIKKGLSVLEGKYDIIHKKQLFHNRSEITVVVKKKIP